jgi:uncharacterized membrane protein
VTEPANPTVRDTTSPERLLALSDGIFAIAMTLLVLQLEVPHLSPQEAAHLPRYLLEMGPRFFVYVLSFLVVATFWMAHHRVFSHVRACDGATRWLNLIFLLFVAFMPFPTDLVGEFPEQRFAVNFYAVVFALTSLLLTTLLWHVAREPSLLRADHDPRWIRALCLRNLAIPAVFLLSIPLSFLSVELAMYSWAVVPLLRRLLDRLIRQPEEPA